MPPTRLPCWMTSADRTALEAAIRELCASTALVPALRTMLEAVSLELGVAEARDQVWPTVGQVRRQASQASPDVLPVRMSEEERAAVLTIPTLDAGVRSRLADEFGRSRW